MVTLVFTDVEESTALLRELGAKAYREVLGEHRRVIRAAFSEHSGYEVDEEGDGFFFAFGSAPAAVEAALEATAGLAEGPVRVRIGVHTGEPLVDPPNYIGEDVHLAARIMSAGHGGQVLLSRATRVLVDSDVRELGEHRLRGFPDPVALFQLGTGRFPPLRTISNTNLPRPASSFVGREREVAEVASLIRDQRARLVTLSGPGGTGKTRLAIEAATELIGDFAAGVFWVGLAPVRDPRIVIDTIARTLGARRELAEHIGDRELLLLLDNFEQVVEAASELTPLLHACPKLRILITSRELLRVQGETTYDVPALVENEAVRLFCARTRATESATVANLCAQLDNLPLAVELAAARMSVLSPEQILERLSRRLDLFRGGRDSDARQRTLRATISWSYDLLSQPERTLFGCLSVFLGGFVLGAAEEVCDASLDDLQSLVDKNLLRHNGGRFSMLETIREFAAERLDESSEGAAIRRRHAWYFLELFEGHDDARREQRETLPEYVSHVRGEQNNARRALAWFRARGDNEETARIVAVLHPLWMASPVEGRRIVDDALTYRDLSDDVRARLLFIAELLAVNQGDDASYKHLLEEDLPLAERRGDRRRVGEALRGLGSIAVRERKFDFARKLLSESERIAVEDGDRDLLAQVATSKAHIPLYQDDLEQAQPLFEEALRLAREAEVPALVRSGLINLAFVVLEQGRLDEAASLYRESLSIRIELSRTFWEIAVEGLAAVAVAYGSATTAARLLAATEAWRRKTGFTSDKPESALADRTAGAARNALGEAAYHAAAKDGATLEPDEAVELALTIQTAS
jgi:predicted ATPase